LEERRAKRAADWRRGGQKGQLIGGEEGKKGR
jgi:hypothetical protein